MSSPKSKPVVIFTGPEVLEIVGAYAAEKYPVRKKTAQFLNVCGDVAIQLKPNASPSSPSSPDSPSQLAETATSNQNQQ